MFSVLIITIGIVVSVALLSKADIKIHITHKHEYPTAQVSPAAMVISQQEVDEAEKKSATPTMDDLVAEIRKIVGGDADAE